MTSLPREGSTSSAANASASPLSGESGRPAPVVSPADAVDAGDQRQPAGARVVPAGRSGAYLGELPALIEAIGAGQLEIATRAVPLRAVEAAWSVPDVPGERPVIIP